MQTPPLTPGPFRCWRNIGYPLSVWYARISRSVLHFGRSVECPFRLPGSLSVVEGLQAGRLIAQATLTLPVARTLESPLDWECKFGLHSCTSLRREGTLIGKRISSHILTCMPINIRSSFCWESHSERIRVSNGPVIGQNHGLLSRG